MIIKTAEQLNRYLADGGDPERVSIEQDPLPTVPTPCVQCMDEGRHYNMRVIHITARGATVERSYY